MASYVVFVEKNKLGIFSASEDQLGNFGPG